MVEAGEAEELEFKWGKKKGTVGGKNKEMRFYESFTYDGVEYKLYDSVYLHVEGDEPYIGKLIKIWENGDKSKEVKILWYFRPCEILNFLEGYEILENELFLASGEGVGLCTTNPLEAIAGKCNVVCISKDSRNPYPPDEELQVADFVFCRFFDVGKLEISDKIDDKVAGVEVKNIFNNLDSQNLVGHAELGLDEKEVRRNLMASNEVVALPSKKDSQPLIEKPRGKSFDTLVRENANSKPSLGKKPSSSIGLKEASKSNVLHTSSRDKSVSQAKENGIHRASLVKQKSSTKLSLGSKDAFEMRETDRIGGNASIEKATLRSKVDFEKDECEVDGAIEGKTHKGLVGDKAFEKGKNGGSSKVLSTEIKNNVPNWRTHDDDVKSTAPSSSKDKYKLQRENDFRDVEDIPSKKLKVGGKPTKVSGEKSHKESTIPQSADHKLDRGVTKVTRRPDDDVKSIAPSSSKDKHKLQRENDFRDVEDIHSKKLKVVGQPTKVSGDKSHKESTIPQSADHKLDRGVTKVTRRPNFDRSKWFKGMSWEERMKTAYEQRRIVLLENLDPSLTSAEVQDIILHGFKENCTAQMIPKTTYSSPHSGQALVIFGKKETAELVIRKLEDGCFLMANGRPLVGRIGPPCFPEKKPTFYGHHVIDHLRMQQREMKDAVSTSHCSQPNNIEYDMAVEWCLLQERADKSWKSLYKQQGEELRKLKAKLKSKI